MGEGMMLDTKILSLLTLAVVAMSAMAASPAQAAGTFAWDSGTIQLTASAASTQKITTTAGSYECNEISGSASVSGTSASTLTMTNIVYKNNGSSSCPLPSFGNATFAGNGCDFLFHAGETEAGTNDSTEGTMDLVCPKSAAVVITAPLGACTITIHPQSGLGPVTYLATTAASPKDADFNLAVTNLKYTHSGFGCGSGTGGSGAFTGSITMKGENSSNVQTNTWLD
jgi:hypothetical protein